MVIPQNVMEAEFDLESDERRSLEERTIFFGTNHKDPNKPLDAKPSYSDPVLALRTLVECMVRLNCLDDVERIISDWLERELNRLIQREQARTFVRIETSSSQQLKTKGGRYAMLLSKAGATTDLRDFRKHLASVISSFGNVMIRLHHLAQIIRYRIVSFIHLFVYVCCCDLFIYCCFAD